MSIYELTRQNDTTLYCNTINATNYDVQNLILNDLNITSTINATSTSSGALIVAGGIAIGKDLFIGGTTNIANISITSTVNSTSPSTGALVIVGGMGIEKDLYVGGSINFSVLGISSTTESTSTSTGAFIVAGGIGIGKNLYVGENTNTPSMTLNTYNLGYNQATVTGLWAGCITSGAGSCILTLNGRNLQVVLNGPDSAGLSPSTSCGGFYRTADSSGYNLTFSGQFPSWALPTTYTSTSCVVPTIQTAYGSMWGILYSTGVFVITTLSSVLFDPLSPPPGYLIHILPATILNFQL
jgi:hypothetical protein